MVRPLIVYFEKDGSYQNLHNLPNLKFKYEKEWESLTSVGNIEYGKILNKTDKK